MKFIKYSLSVLLISIQLWGCAQEKNIIKRIVAFSSVRMPGNIPVDEDGNSLFKGPETINTIYIETKQKGMQWDKAWKDGKTYAVTATLLPIGTYHAGTEKKSGKKIIYTAEEGCQQWLLELEPTDKVQKSPVALKNGEILLNGKYGTRVITQLIKQQTELEVLPAY